MRPGRSVTPALFTELTAKVAGHPSAGVALRAVLELHTPDEEGGDCDPPEWAPWQTPLPVALVCYAEGHDGEPWPCPTVRVIAAALSVSTGGDDHVHKSS
jgi:hypothetical protein